MRRRGYCNEKKEGNATVVSPGALGDIQQPSSTYYHFVCMMPSQQLFVLKNVVAVLQPSVPCKGLRWTWSPTHTNDD